MLIRLEQLTRYRVELDMVDGEVVARMSSIRDGHWLKYEDVEKLFTALHGLHNQADLEALALKYHKEVEGEYGCGYPQSKCPGVLRLIELLQQAALPTGKDQQ
jgi:hypothetical protein